MQRQVQIVRGVKGKTLTEWLFLQTFNILEKYYPIETAEQIANVITGDAREDFLILIDGRQGLTGKTTLCNKLKSLGYNAEELWKYASTEREDRDDNFVGIIISLNELLF